MSLAYGSALVLQKSILVQYSTVTDKGPTLEKLTGKGEKQNYRVMVQIRK